MLLYILFLILVSSDLICGNKFGKCGGSDVASTLEASAMLAELPEKPKPYLSSPLKKVPSLKILSAYASIAYRKEENFNILPGELKEYVLFFKKYEHDYSKALFMAAQFGYVYFIKDLIALGADENKLFSVPLEKGGELPINALMNAICNGHLSFVQALVNEGANIYKTNENDDTILHIAVRTKNDT